MEGNVYQRLQAARVKFQERAVKATGKNEFSNYTYIDLGDFLPSVQVICQEFGLCGHISYGPELSTLEIHNVAKPEEFIAFTSPMSTATLKGCHAVQNLGAVQTYLRRYLWLTAFEIVEHDALDSGVSTGTEPPANKPPIVETPNDTAPVMITPEQLYMLKKEFALRGVDVKRFLKAAEVKKLEDIQQFNFMALLTQVKSKPLIQGKGKGNPPEETKKPEGVKAPDKFECPEAPGAFFTRAECWKPDVPTACCHTCKAFKEEQK